MKRIFISLFFLASSHAFAATDPASQSLQSTLNQGLQILSLKSVPAQQTQLCQLVTSAGDLTNIGPQLLGDYANLASDQAGVTLFYKQMPSLAVTAMMKNLDKATGASVVVDPTSSDQGNGIFSVGVTATLANGNTYNASVLLRLAASAYLITDGSYMGFSGVNYLGNQIQNQIGDEANTSPNTPVSAWMQKQMADSSYVKCP